MVVEEIVTRKEILAVMGDVVEIMTEKAEIGLVQSVTILILPFERSVIAVKQTDLEMEEGNSKENLNEVVTISKKEEIGLVLSATTLTSPSEINAIAVELIGLVLAAGTHREIEVTKTVVLDLKEARPDEVEDERRGAQVNHEDLDSEAQVEVALEVIDQEEVAVGAEFGSPQHSFCLILSKTYDEQGGYALGRCSRA